MNLYAQHHDDGETVYLSVVEGVYESRMVPKARELVNVNLTENKIMKLVKQPYDVINVGDNTVTLKKRRYDMNTHVITYAEIYTILSQLLEEHGYTQERIEQIQIAINNIASNTTIRPHWLRIYENQWHDFQ